MAALRTIWDHVLLIAGPTASGKSALALRIAERLGGEIINADSMQIYRDLRIITARPTPAEEATVPHRLFGYVDAATNYSVGRWLADAARAIAEARERGRRPILVGGTGLYFKALLRGLSDIPAAPDAIRRAVRLEAEGRSPQELHAVLAERDPEMAAKLQPTDPQRILRALEIYAATGRSLASFQAARGEPVLTPGSWRGFFLAPDRADLRRRIDARFDDMIGAGALEEVRALAARRLDPRLPSMRAHGVPGLMAALEGAIALGAAIERGKADTRRYVKRQFTFIRHQLPEFVEVAPQRAETCIMESIACNV